MENSRISHYEVGRRLGRGGMGEVYAAVDLDLERQVALKFVAPELAADPDALKRFEREARAAAALNHPHIATLFAFERDGSRTFIAMELVSGESLRERMKRGPLPVAEALAIARDVAGALALAHRRGISHRDVKPENLMFDEDGLVKLMDFGLARATHLSRMTMTGSSLGTAAYMPPESVRGGAGAPGDVFALGVMLHEMLVGELPFSGDSPLALLYTIANEDPKPLRAARPEVPDAVEALVRRMLEKDPDARPDAAAVARELAMLTGAPLPAIPNDTVELEVARVAAAAGKELVPAGTPGALVAAAPARRRAPRWRWIVGGLVLLLAAAGLWELFSGMAIGAREARFEPAKALNNQGVIALQRNDLAEARRSFESAVREAPDYGVAQLNLARVEFALGFADTAARRLHRLLRAHRGRSDEDRRLRADTWSALGDIAVGDANWNDAVRSYQQSFQEDSSDARAYNQLGWALVRAGLGSEAVVVLARGQARFPTEKALHKNAALALLAMNDPRGAERDAAQALLLDPSYAAAHAAMARAHARLGHLAEARTEWTAFLGHPHDAGDSVATVAELRAAGVLR